MKLVRSLRAVSASVAAALLLTGCQGAYDLPLPGGAAGGSDVYRVSIEFTDVMDLVPQSAVRVNDVTVGSVESIDLDDWTAVVVVRLEDHVKLPDNAVAELRQTSLLGEKFVSLKAPADGEGVGELSDGDLIPLERSGRNPEVEEVLGALSLLLNGGGVAQLQTINRELNNALEGRESDVRGALEELNTFVGGLEQQKSEIVRALEGLDRLAATLAAQKDDIAYTLEQMPQALSTLEENRALLTQMLTALSELGVVAKRVIDASQADTVANLRALQPILTRLNEAGEALPASLQLLFTYPFNDSAVNAMHGDYTNLHLTLDADLAKLQNLHPPDEGGHPPPQSQPPPQQPLPVKDLCKTLGLGDNCELPDADALCAALGKPSGCSVTVEELCANDGLAGTLGDKCPDDASGGSGGGVVPVPVPGLSGGTSSSAGDLERLLTGGVSP